MRTELAPCLAVLLVVATIAQPALAAPHAAATTSAVAQPVVEAAVTSPDGVATSVAHAAAPPDARAATAAEIDAQRRQIETRLLDLGRSADEASASADLLTEADLQVLCANPDMMQEAGISTFWTIMIGVLIIAGIVAIAASSNGSVAIFGD